MVISYVLIKKLPVPTKRGTMRFTRVKSCNALWRMLLIRIRSYLKSVLRYKFLTLATYHPDTIYIREQEFEDPWLFFKAKRGSRAKRFGKECNRQL
jgi:hypothetical protein